MIAPRIVRRYATALFNAASKAGAVDQVESDLGLVTYTLEQSVDLMAAIESPVIPAERKRAVISDLFEDKVHRITLAYLYLLVDKRREEAILRTEAEFIRLANKARGIMVAQVTTAVELTREEQTAMAQKLSAVMGKTISLEPIVDPRVIGGVLVRVGDTVIDGSIRGQLAALREKLAS